jgi:two-component system sensor kinase FixL
VTTFSPFPVDLIDALPDPVIGIDAQRRIVAWNRAAEAAYGYSRPEALGRPARELLRTRFPAPLAEIRETLADTGAWHGTLVHVARDGVEVTVDSRWSARRDERGATIGALCVEREHATATPGVGATRERQPPHRTDHLGEVAATVGHDFNNILAVIVNYSALIAGQLEAMQIATGEEPWATLRSDVGEIQLAAERATVLARKLLAAAHQDSGDGDGLPYMIGEPVTAGSGETRVDRGAD